MGEEEANGMEQGSAAASRRSAPPARSGDAAAAERAREIVERLTEEHWERLYRVAYSVLRNQSGAEEATQEALLKMLRHCAATGFVAARPGSDDEEPGGLASSVIGLAVTTVRNTAIDELRRRRRHHEALAEHEHRTARRHGEASPAEAAEARELREALSTLTAEQELVVLLHAYEGWTFREIAERHGGKESAVSMRYYRAIEKLRERLGDADGAGRGRE